MTCRRTHREEYETAEEVVKLSIDYGDAQLGSSLVKLDDRELARGDAIHDLSIGQGAGLTDSALSIKSVVTDVNDMTDRTSVTYALTGGATDLRCTLECIVDRNGDSAIYRTTFDFVTGGREGEEDDDA